MPLEKRRVREVVLGTVPDFIDFHIHLPPFLWQLRCFVERITEEDYQKEAATAAAVFLTGAKDFVRLFCCSSICYCSECQQQVTLKLTSNVQDWIDSVVDFGKQNCNISSSQKPIIWFPELLFKFIRGLYTVLGLSKLIVNLR